MMTPRRISLCDAAGEFHYVTPPANFNRDNMSSSRAKRYYFRERLVRGRRRKPEKEQLPQF
jgi:hypothetical protein